jgi:hypothetical protein
MRENRTSSSMRGRRKRATAQRACALLYGGSPLVGGAAGFWRRGGNPPAPAFPREGETGKGASRPHQSFQPLVSPKSHFPKRVKPAFLLAANDCAHPTRRPKIPQQNRPTSQIPAHSPKNDGEVQKLLLRKI